MSTGLSDSNAKLASEEGVEEKCSQKVIWQLAKTFPFPKHENRDIWLGYLLPTRSVLECCVHSFDEEVLLCNVAESYRILGNFREVELMYRRVLKLKGKLLVKSILSYLNI